jgi:uncharacterized protein (DUF2336 family)
MGQSLIAELEEAIESGSKDKRIDALRRVTDLFLADADRLTDLQIEIFDDVLGHLIKRIETKALAELSRRLAPIHNAPLEMVRQLARNDDITVAEPILAASARLSDGDLVEIASTKTQAHLLVISMRPADRHRRHRRIAAARTAGCVSRTCRQFRRPFLRAWL